MAAHQLFSETIWIVYNFISFHVEHWPKYVCFRFKLETNRLSWQFASCKLDSSQNQIYNMDYLLSMEQSSSV